MMNYWSNQFYTNALLNPSLERSFHLSIKEIKKPFQYKKIPLDNTSNHKRKRSKNTAHTVKRIWSYLAKEKARLTVVIMLVLISSGLSLLGPYMIGMAIDNYIVTKQTA